MTRSLPRRARILVAAGAALVALGALAGCSAHPGDAAVVTMTSADGATSTVAVTQDQVDTATRELSSLQVTPSDVAGILAQLPVVERVLTDHGVTVTDADVQDMADAMFANAGLSTPELSQASLDVLRFQALKSRASHLDQDGLDEVNQDLAAAMSDTAVTMSPRFDIQSWIVSSGSNQ